MVRDMIFSKFRFKNKVYLTLLILITFNFAYFFVQMDKSPKLFHPIPPKQKNTLKTECLRDSSLKIKGSNEDNWNNGIEVLDMISRWVRLRQGVQRQI